MTMGRMRRAFSSESGQMMVELAVMMPVLIIVAVMAVNIVTFFSECAAFDRIACNAIRIQAASPSYGQDAAKSASLVEQTIDDAMRLSEKEYLDLAVSVSGRADGKNSFRATLLFAPTLFGMGLKSSIFGVPLPRIEHATELVVEPYRPGMLL